MRVLQPPRTPACFTRLPAEDAQGCRYSYESRQLVKLLRRERQDHGVRCSLHYSLHHYTLTHSVAEFFIPCQLQRASKSCKINSLRGFFVCEFSMGAGGPSRGTHRIPLSPYGSITYRTFLYSTCREHRGLTRSIVRPDATGTRGINTQLPP